MDMQVLDAQFSRVATVQGKSCVWCYIRMHMNRCCDISEVCRTACRRVH
jgi:hypothetical protein